MSVSERDTTDAGVVDGIADGHHHNAKEAAVAVEAAIVLNGGVVREYSGLLDDLGNDTYTPSAVDGGDGDGTSGGDEEANPSLPIVDSQTVAATVSSGQTGGVTDTDDSDGEQGVDSDETSTNDAPISEAEGHFTMDAEEDSSALDATRTLESSLEKGLSNFDAEDLQTEAAQSGDDVVLMGDLGQYADTSWNVEAPGTGNLAAPLLGLGDATVSENANVLGPLLVVQ